MTTLIARRPDAAHWPQASAAISAAFGQPARHGADERDHLKPAHKRLALLDGERVVGGCFAYPLALSLPGGAEVAVAGLAGVGILPTEQGRGGLRALIEAHLRDCRAQGDVASVLMASESGLYRRFGYGPVTEMVSYRLDTRAFALGEPLADVGAVELITDEACARQVCAQIHAAQSQAAELQRSPAWWEQVIHSGERSWLGGGEQFVAVHRDGAGVADAYALYVVESVAGMDHGNQRARVELRELVSLTPQAQASMFQYLCGIAWVRELHWQLAPVDPPIRHLMCDPRQLVPVSRCDMLWMRVLDLTAVLTQRCYHESARVDFHYEDALFPEDSGGYRLHASAEPGQTRLERRPASVETAIRLGPEQLAAVALGGTRLVELWRAGQIGGPQDDIRRLDRLLLTDEAPFNLSKF